MPVSASPCPKRMEEQGFVSKKARVGKSRIGGQRRSYRIGNIIRYCGPQRQIKPAEPHLFVTLPPGRGGYISRSHGFRACSAQFPAGSQEKPLKNNIRSAGGTPVNSGRFRQAVNIRKKKCADKYCRIDCQSLHAVCFSHGPGRAHSGDSGGLLYGPALLHQHRHQHADFAQSGLAQARQPVRARPSIANERSLPWWRRRRRNSPARRAHALAQKLSGDTEHFESVAAARRPENSLKRTGCCSCPRPRSARLTGQFESAAPLIEIMAGDPSIRGLTGALETGLAGVKRGQVKLDSTERPFNLIAQTVENVLNKGSATFSWRELISDKPLTDSDRRAFIEFKPILDFNALEPGKDATDAIRQAAQRPQSRGRIWRAGQADRTGSDRQRGIRHRSGRRRRQRHRHRARGAVDSLDGAAFAEDHLRGVRQSLHRPFHHHRRRADDGGFAEPALDRVRRSVRRTGRRLRHPVQRPLPLGALQEQRSAGGAGAGGRTLRGAAVAGGDGDRGRIPLVPADRLQGHLRTRRDRRRRHAGGVYSPASRCCRRC